ncbi:hypothetical protein PYCC9005_003000 [Savitreella phatthalungensis]
MLFRTILVLTASATALALPAAVPESAAAVIGRDAVAESAPQIGIQLPLAVRKAVWEGEQLAAATTEKERDAIEELPKNGISAINAALKPGYRSGPRGARLGRRRSEVLAAQA